MHGRLEFIQGAAIMPVSHAPLTPTIVPLLNDWLAFLKGQAANPVSGGEGLTSLSVCDACLRAARLGEWVEVASPAMP